MIKTHLTNWRLSAGCDVTIMDGNNARMVTIPCGGMTGRTYAQAADIARLIAAAPALLEALRALLDEIAKSPCADSILDSAAAGHAFAALSQAGGASE